jgi:hypothetical protein
MRLWSLHPRYLDSKGLVALWREALLARKVLKGLTVGYRHHPQLLRFRACRDPVASVNRYLECVYAEAWARGYSFDPAKLEEHASGGRIAVNKGQLAYEFALLKRKLRRRDRTRWSELERVRYPSAHPQFRVVSGGMEPWEKRRDRWAKPA